MKKIITLIILILLNTSIPYTFGKSNAIKETSIPADAKKVNEVDSKARKKNSNLFSKIFHAPPEKPIPNIRTDIFEVYFIDGFKYKKPANYARTAAVQALVQEINQAEISVDFAVFGFSSQPELLKSLLKARSRGVQIRWVTDMTPWNFNFYNSGTKEVLKAIPTCVTDYLTDKKLLEYHLSKGWKTYNGTLMHNKYFVIDNKVVWTGSTNISSACSGGYNTNVSILIRSEEIANLYTQDFEKMYVEKSFHRDKAVLYKKDIALKDNSDAQIYFSPTNKILYEGILPVIDNSKNYVYMPIFYLTSEPIFDALKNAQKRGVDVKIIADAHYATDQHSKIKELREAGLLIKVENWGGKMHMKSLIVDDEYSIFGSCNFTKSGINQGDENMVILKNFIIAKKFKEKFESYWIIIPDKWLYETPKPEGPDSFGSCSDGLDNDHDGLIDKNDPDCQ